MLYFFIKLFSNYFINTITLQIPHIISVTSYNRSIVYRGNFKVSSIVYV